MEWSSQATKCSLYKLYSPSGRVSNVFSFSWELKWPQEKQKTILTQKFGVTNKEYYGMLWYFLEWSIATRWSRARFGILLGTHVISQ